MFKNFFSAVAKTVKFLKKATALLNKVVGLVNMIAHGLNEILRTQPEHAAVAN